MLLALAALWGGSFFFFKVLVAELPPFTVVLGRVGLAAVILNLWLGLRGDFMPASPRLREFVGMGLIGVGLAFIDGRRLATFLPRARPAPAPFERPSDLEVLRRRQQG